jgi:prolipoprotein diacylglyceryltransferase/protein-S-isoprenylcysteine O-methyltransferase Ste14
VALTRVGTWLYGAAFALLLPLGLVRWAGATAGIVHIPLRACPPLGLPLALAGACLLLLGMHDLWIYGGGLPMNAYPPPHYVNRGIYAQLPHPIYVGFVMACVGVSIAVGSASGLWLVSPLVALGCTALVLGYEQHDLASRFGRAPRPLLPVAGLTCPTARDRLACYLFVFVPWVVLYEGVIALGLPPDATTAHLAFEPDLPVLEWCEAFYFSAYVVTGLAPLFARTRDDLRSFCVRALWAMVIAFSLYLALPFGAPQRGFTPHTPLGRLLSWERTLDNAAGAFPSFHVIWGFLSADVYARRAQSRFWKGAWLGWAWLVAASCVATGQHPIADVAAGMAVAALVVRGGAVWQWIRSRGELIANSWHEWRIGPVRIINHGVYVGAGACLALWLALSFAGPGRQAPVLVAALGAVVGAALWAQYVEGSTQLLRPFGFYGGLLGGTLGALSAPLFGTSAWVVLAAFSVAGPWAQAMGRLRCLVQGCCHGRPATEWIGIRYLHPRSRVVRLTEWAGVPVHPTPIYSLLWNVFVGGAIIRLWMLHAPMQLIVGIYFALNGLGRFVEEAFRGEPQTPIFARLRLYQWAAVVSVLAGALMTALGASDPAPAANFEWTSLLPSAAFGLLVGCAMGVDLPDSNWRFSRLA